MSKDTIKPHARLIFITGGVVSSLGKGLALASIGLILKEMHYSVRFVKCDPYLNVDPGTMSPIQHGEVFVTEDGIESDLDLGHYERFTGQPTSKLSNITSGRIYTNLLTRERRGDFLGQTVQTIPHVTSEIKSAIRANIDENTDFLLCEIGGTVGDMEALPFLEAIRQMGFEVGSKGALFIHMTLVPFLRSTGELKTKPTQHSVRELRSIGIQPDVLLCRGEFPLSLEERRKVGGFCNVPETRVINALDVKDIYEVPQTYSESGLDKIIVDHFELRDFNPLYLDHWKNLVEKASKGERLINIAIVGKYTRLSDSYKSLIESLYHACAAIEAKLHIEFIDAKNESSEDPYSVLDSEKKLHGIIIPGGFGSAGIEGKISAIKYARENKIPFLGICIGMQLAIIEFARNVLGLEGANSKEFEEGCMNPLIIQLAEWQQMNEKKFGSKTDLGATMRLGNYKCILQKDTLASNIYKTQEIEERHRHRYEFNDVYKSVLEEGGVVFSGLSACGNLAEIIELSNQPWFLAVQFHPEFKSSLMKPHPIFVSFVTACQERELGLGL